MRAGIWQVLVALLALAAGVTGALAQAAQCSKTDFENVVDEAAGALRDLTRANTPQFQAKLRQLKDKRGWSQDEFIASAEPFVRDEQIETYDRTSEELVAKIATLGQKGGNAATPDCNLLGELRGYMAELVRAQQSKWTYMFAKIDAELRK